MQIITNNQQRPIIQAYELREEEQKEFDYIDFNDDCSASFFKYKGELYDLGEFFTTQELHDSKVKEWDGYQSDNYFSGIVIKYSQDYESVIVGTYIS